MHAPSKRRWVVVAVFFAFMLLHQSDKLLIGPLTTPIMETFQIDEVRMGAVFTVALVVGSILYPLWGYLYDRFARSKLLALASLVWGATTWLSAIAPTFPTFLASRASTGIDDSSYPGLYSLVSDYFGPTLRGKVYGLLQLTMPLGYLIGMGLALGLPETISWRTIYYGTGTIGILLAGIILLVVRDVRRGKSEPELAGLEQIGLYRFDPKAALSLLRKRSIFFLFAQGFVGVFPWQVISSWFFRYLEIERNYDDRAILVTMIPAVLVLAGGYFVGGAIGDYAFKRTPRGRMLVAMAGVLLGAIALAATMSVPAENQGLFLLLLCITAIFMPIAAPNVISTVYDITLPEVRSSALAIQYFIENGGAALAPLLAGILAKETSLHQSILIICVSAWVLGSIFLACTAYLVPQDIATLRLQLRERAELEKAKELDRRKIG
jgi:MFS family permease